jgi:predicted nucleic acid-binding protein
MRTQHKKYCLDANVLIRAWRDYYAPRFCSNYWDVLSELGAEGRIFLPQMVYEEITRTDDDLTSWLKKSRIAEHKIDGPVTEYLKKIYAVNPAHKNLVDNTRNRSLADPWVIAHALKEDAVVVTKEEKVTAVNTTKIKIPNVCNNMGVRCINDFEFVEELNIQFSCHIP